MSPFCVFISSTDFIENQSVGRLTGQEQWILLVKIWHPGCCQSGREDSHWGTDSTRIEFRGDGDENFEDSHQWFRSVLTAL